MALLYLGNKLIESSQIKFAPVENNFEKTFACMVKFNYERTLLGFECGVYSLIISSVFNKNLLALSKQITQDKNLCRYNFNRSVHWSLNRGMLIALPLVVYRTIQYINNEEHHILKF